MCLGLLIKGYSKGYSKRYSSRDRSFGCRGLQYLQLHFSAHFASGSDSDRQSDVRARDMPGTQAKCHWNSEIAYHSQNHFLERVILSWALLAIHHFAEDNAAHVFQLARELQLHQHAINLVRLGCEVLHEENRPRGVDVIRRAQRRYQDGKTSAIEDAFCRSRHQRLRARVGANFPFRSSAERVLP